MWGRRDSQEVGLEAAILERVRNSSLVKRSCADNSPGLKRATEAAGGRARGGSVLVGEHSAGGEGRPEGRLDVAEAMMPARVAIKTVKIRLAESLRVPGEGSSAQG
jgi:hypothetical protein